MTIGFTHKSAEGFGGGRMALTTIYFGLSTVVSNHKIAVVVIRKWVGRSRQQLGIYLQRTTEHELILMASTKLIMAISYIENGKVVTSDVRAKL